LSSWWADPVFIEVKAGGRLGERGQKQLEDIKTLHGFYQTDVAKGLRGFPELRRQAVELPEVGYVPEMNRCIQEAAAIGVGIVSPEDGLYYAAIYDDHAPMADLFKQMKLSRPMVYTLNSAKSGRSWAPYTPFTLSIESAEHLYDFIRGQLFLMVIVDIPVLCKGMERPGYDISWVEGEDYPLKLKGVGTEDFWRVSQHLLNRIGFEFVSPRWITDCQQAMIDRVTHEIDMEETRGNSGSE
jgi:hypothetical protein